MPIDMSYSSQHYRNRWTNTPNTHSQCQLVYDDRNTPADYRLRLLLARQASDVRLCQLNTARVSTVIGRWHRVHVDTGPMLNRLFKTSE
jgi:hypothetical protein